jgi:hypothetical protein
MVFTFILFSCLLIVPVTLTHDHSGGAQNLPQITGSSRISAEDFVNFTVDCDVDKSGIVPVYIIRYYGLSVNEVVSNLFIHICARPFDLLSYEPTEFIKVGLARTELLFNQLPNQVYLQVTKPQDVHEFVLSYSPPAHLTSMRPNRNFCLPSQSWSVFTRNSNLQYGNAKPIIGPVC